MSCGGTVLTPTAHGRSASEKKAWYDHGQQRGGSTLDLVAYSKDQPKQQLRGPTFFETWAEAYQMGLVPDPPPKKPNGGGGPILATYPYTDENGALLFEVVRFNTADRDQRFRQRRHDGNGGWIWDLVGGKVANLEDAALPFRGWARARDYVAAAGIERGHTHGSGLDNQFLSR
jgi:hypothetical protein